MIDNNNIGKAKLIPKIHKIHKILKLHNNIKANPIRIKMNKDLDLGKNVTAFLTVLLAKTVKIINVFP